MSAQQVPPLSQGAPDFDADSDYLGTPVDPPSTCQPYVADYEPLEYYYPSGGYDNTEYATGHPSAQYGDSAIVGASPQHGLLLQTNFPISSPEDCNHASDGAMAAYHLMPPNHLPTNGGSGASATRPSSNPPKPSPDAVNSFAPARRADSSSPHSSNGFSLQYPEYEGDNACRGQKSSYPPIYSKAVFQPPELSCNTTVSYALTDVQSSYPSVYSSSFTGNAAYGHRGYYEETYVDSPIDDPTYGDRFSDQAYDQHAGYDHYQQHPETHADTRFASGSLQRNQNVRFYQPPSCPYTYPYVDPAAEGSDYASSSPLSRSSAGYLYPVIHAPRPQQVHDIYTLHSNTCPQGDSSPALAPIHRVLSIPSVPAPPPVPRPTSLIEDSPKKPLTLACFFCRKRKIACQSPPANSQDRTCNQCAKRKIKCVYPATSRRGIRPRVYDLSDESFRRPPLPLL